jgi:Ca2+-binding EF-hand superfamily protein
MTSQLAYKDDSGPIEPDLDTYIDFDELIEYCRNWKPKNKDLKSKFKDYEQDIRGYFELETLLGQLGNIDTVSKKRLIKEIKRLIRLQNDRTEKSASGLVISSTRRT